MIKPLKNAYVVTTIEMSNSWQCFARGILEETKQIKAPQQTTLFETLRPGNFINLKKQATKRSICFSFTAARSQTFIQCNITN